MIDVDDLWEEQLKYGTAVEGKGDTMEDVFKIADEYCMKFQTASGKKGVFKPSKGIEFLSDYLLYEVTFKLKR